MAGTELRVVIPETAHTRALLDGSVSVRDFDVVFDPSGHSGPAASARLRGRIEPEIAGAEQVIPDYLVRASRGVGQRLVALPVFLTRGMVHRKYIGRRGGPRPSDLGGRRIGMSRVLAATAVFLRGALSDTYSVSRGSVTWVAAEPFASDEALGGDWPLLENRLGIKAPDLLDLLARGELDAVLYPGGGGGNWYEWTSTAPASRGTSHYGDMETLVRDRPALEFTIGTAETTREWFGAVGVYPLFHMMALHEEVAEQHPGLPQALTEAFGRSGREARRYLSPEQQRLYDKEIELLGVDPNEAGLNPLNTRSIVHLLDLLEEDGVLPRRPSLQEIFPYAEGA